MPIPNRAAHASKSETHVSDDCYMLHQAPSLAELMQPLETEAEENAADELDCLKCINTDLVERVKKLEAQIEATKAGLVEIFNQRLSSEEITKTENQQISESGASVCCQELADENVAMRELVGYLMPEAYNQTTFEDIRKMAIEWQRQKNVLRRENDQLDQMIKQLRGETATSNDPGPSEAMPLETTLEELETTLSTKSQRIVSLENRVVTLERESADFSSKIDSCEEERKELETLIESEKTAHAQTHKALSKETLHVQQLTDELQARERSLQRLKARLTALESNMEQQCDPTSSQKKVKSRRSIVKAFTKFLTRQGQSKNVATISPSKEPIIHQAPPPHISHHDSDDLNGSTSKSDAIAPVVAMMEQQLNEHQRVSDDLRRRLNEEERVRMNLERLLSEGNELLHSLIITCKARLRDSHRSIRQSLNGVTDVHLMKIIEFEFENVINFLDRLQPIETHTSIEMTQRYLIAPSPDPLETRSKPKPME